MIKTKARKLRVSSLLSFGPWKKQIHPILRVMGVGMLLEAMGGVPLPLYGSLDIQEVKDSKDLHMSPRKREKLSDSLAHNIYAIRNISTTFSLACPLETLYEAGQSLPATQGGELKEGFRWIQRSKGMCLQHLISEHCLSYEDQGTQPMFSPFDKDREEDFLWILNPVKECLKGNALIFHIQHQGTGKFLFFKKIIEKQNKKVLTSYAVEVSDLPQNPSSQEAQDYFEEAPSDPYAWRFHPFYPEAGSSDFLMIAKDFGEVLARRHDLSLKSPLKISKTTVHDPCSLSVGCEGKTHLNLNPGDKGYLSYVREIFSSRDILRASRDSTLKVSRVIETEEIFQTSIKNSLNVHQKKAHSQEKSAQVKKAKSQKKSEQATKDQTQMSYQDEKDQKIFSQTLNTLLSVSLSTASETSQTHSDSRSSSSQSFSREMDRSKAQDTSHTKVGVKASAEGSFFGWGAKASASFGHENLSYRESEQERVQENQSSSSHQESHTSTQKRSEAQNKTTQEGSSKSEESLKSQKTGHSREDRQSTTIGHSQEERQSTAQELSQENSFSLERSINVGELKSVTNRKSEKWEIVREIPQSSESLLQVKFYEHVIEVDNFGFTVNLKLSGYVGYLFDPPCRQIKHNPYRDYFQGSLWCMTPATIVSQMPAPGYHPNADGSVTYKAKGNLDLKYPINVFSVITEMKNSSFTTAEKEPTLLSVHRPSSSSYFEEQLQGESLTEEKDEKATHSNQTKTSHTS